MSVYKRGRLWWYKFQFQGRPIRRPTKFTNRTAALRAEAKHKADLLDTNSAGVAPVTDLRRREMLRKLGLAGAAALLIPAITTLTATPAYAIGTGCVLSPGACTANAQCCSGICGRAGCSP